MTTVELASAIAFIIAANKKRVKFTQTAGELASAIAIVITALSGAWAKIIKARSTKRNKQPARQSPVKDLPQSPNNQKPRQPANRKHQKPNKKSASAKASPVSIPAINLPISESSAKAQHSEMMDCL
jgi:hypothetical protein